MERTDGDIYVNIQGDEPTIRAEHIELLLHPLLNGKSEVTTLKVAIDGSSRSKSECRKSGDGQKGPGALFFTLPIPFERDAKARIRYYKHIGLYGYTRAALQLFHSLPQSSAGTGREA